MPFSGITVVELGEAVAGPMAGQILGDMGATVIKVENPDAGDSSRSMGPPMADGAGAIFHAVNRNKRSLALDLKDPDQRALLEKFLVEEADVMLDSYRPSVSRKLGLDPEALIERNPRLVYCSLNAYSRHSVSADKPGYDIIMEAVAGIMSVTGEEGGGPVRGGVALVDILTSIWSAFAIATALHRRERTGRGGLVETALFDSAMAVMTVPFSIFQAGGEAPRRWGTAHPGACPVQVFDAGDGQMAIAAANDRQFERLAKALGHGEWTEDQRFQSNRTRWANRDALVEAMHGVLRTAPRAHWTRVLEDAAVPAAPVRGVPEVMADPDVEASGVMAPVPGS
ncbi:MAG: CaiB/BaiF CoA transferase family protein, partial [Alphaproteobacteria bacterium]